MALAAAQDRPMCVACGTQFDLPANETPKNCKICDDPRQFVPPDGQSWTSLRELNGAHSNKWKLIDAERTPGVWTIWTEPKFAIGQRCSLITTPKGNVLWDCIAYLDEATETFIKGKGGLDAIVISHPHYYTTHMLWAQTFKCPVYIAAEDEEWCVMPDPTGLRRLVAGAGQTILPGVEAIKLGGHFPGSLVLRHLPPEHAETPEQGGMLFIADSFVTVPSALYHVDRPPGTSSYSFLWSIPNMIPLSAKEITRMWQVLRRWRFGSTHGAFLGQDVWDAKVKGRVLESMKIQCRAMGWEEAGAEVLKETWP